jgi:hypothetical protein
MTRLLRNVMLLAAVLVGAPAEAASRGDTPQLQLQLRGRPALLALNAPATGRVPCANAACELRLGAPRGAAIAVDDLGVEGLRARWEEMRQSRAAWRRAGWMAAGAGVAAGLASATFTVLANREARRAASPADALHGSHEDRYRMLAASSGVAAIALAGVGLGLVLFHRDPGEFHPTVAVIRGTPVIGLAGTLP